MLKYAAASKKKGPFSMSQEETVKSFTKRSFSSQRFEMSEEPTIYLWYERILSVISIPINLFTLYCILKKTPIEMREYRIHLAIAQILTILLEFVLLAIQPELYFPAFCGRVFGIWDTVFELGAANAFATGGFLVCSSMVAVNQLFFFKYQSLLPSESRYKLTNFGKTAYIASLYLIWPNWLFWGFKLIPIEKGTDSELFKEMITLNPSYAYLSNYTDLYVGTFRPIWPPYINFSAITLVVVGIFAFAVTDQSLDTAWILICNYLITHESGYMSEKTRKMQKKFFTALWIQHFIPTAAIALPWVYYAILIVSQGNTINQGLNNFFCAILSSHGTFTSLSLLLLTQPYRNYCFHLLDRIAISKFFGQQLSEKRRASIAIVSMIAY